MSFVVPHDVAPAGSRTVKMSPPQHAAMVSPSMLSFLRNAAAALLVLTGSGIAWASIGLSFGGVSQPINTGTITLSAPAGIVVDTAGDVYIADTGHSQIVVVNPQGVASVLTINGLSPGLSSPMGLALDGSGNLYIADSVNSRIVKVDTSGNGTVVSTGGVTLATPQGVVLDQSGDLFIADTGNSRIVEVPAAGSAAPLAITGVVPTSPVGLAVDTKGNLYIADVSGNRVITVAATTTVGVLLTISGGLTLNAPTAVAVDSFGNVFIADTGNHRIAEVDTSGNGNVLQTVGIELDSPKAVAVDVFGAIYIADAGGNQAVVADQQFTPSVVSGHAGYSLNRTAVGFGHIQLGSSTPVTLTLHFSIGAAPVLGAVGVYTSGAPNLDFKVTTGASACTSGFASGICNVYVQFLPTAPGLRSGAVVLYDSATPANPILTIPLYGFGDSPMAALSPGTASLVSFGGATLSAPFQVAFDPAGDMYVANYANATGNVVKVPAGGGSATVVSTGGFTLAGAIGVALDGAGNLYISDHYNNRVLVVSPAGSVSSLTINGLGSTGLNIPGALALDAAGNLYIADYGNGRIVKVAPNGFGSVLATKGFTFPPDSVLGVAVDIAGTVYIPDSSGNRVVKVTAAGAASLVVPAGITPALRSPQGVAVDAFGNLYIADAGNRRIVEITTAGVASMVQMPGQTLVTDYGVTVDLSGNVFIPDFSANHIVKVNVLGATLPAFPNTNVGASSITQVATVTNLGDQALVFSANPTFTANFSQPTGSTNQCLMGTSLTGGLACNVSVQFTPQSVGVLSAGILVTDNTLNVPGSTQQVSVSGTGLTTGDTTATAVVTNPTAANIGQPITVTANVTDTAAGHSSTIPTGGVTFMDTVGSTVVSLNGGSAVTLSAGVATLTGVTLSGAGTHTITANYVGVNGTFLTSSNTTTLIVSKTPVVVTGPLSQPFQVVNGQAGSVPITVTGPYSGLAVPTGSVNYSVLNASNTSVASGSATLTGGSANSTAAVPIANTLAAGTYMISASYGGDSNYAASATATTIQLLVGQITPVIAWTPPTHAIIYGVTLSAVLNATAANGSTPVTGTFSYTATLQGGTAAAVTGPSILGAGAYTLNVTFTPTDTITYASASASILLTVSQASPAIALASSANVVLTTTPVTFMATVSSTVSTPTGSVGFYDGTSLLGSGALSAGVATYTTSSLAIGSHTIAAVYGGDINFMTMTSASVTETVQDFALNVTSGGPTTATVVPGGTATYALTIGPTGGVTFPGPITLSVSGLPPGATATLTPSTLPAGAGPTPVALSVQLPSSTAALHRSDTLARDLSPLMLGMLLLPFGGKIRRIFGSPIRKQPTVLLLLAGIVLLGLSGCGDKTGFFGNAPQTYTLTVTATSGTLSHSTTLTLTVQ